MKSVEAKWEAVFQKNYGTPKDRKSTLFRSRIIDGRDPKALDDALNGVGGTVVFK